MDRNQLFRLIDWSNRLLSNIRDRVIMLLALSAYERRGLELEFSEEKGELIIRLKPKREK